MKKNVTSKAVKIAFTTAEVSRQLKHVRKEIDLPADERIGFSEKECLSALDKLKAARERGKTWVTISTRTTAAGRKQYTRVAVNVTAAKEAVA